MIKYFKKMAAVFAAVMMVMVMSLNAFAATPTECKFTKSDGNALAMGMGTGLIESCDLTDGIATVTFKTMSILWYNGDIADITGDAVGSWDSAAKTAKIDMRQASDASGAVVHIVFDFNMTPPGMSDSMDVRFVCY